MTKPTIFACTALLVVSLAACSSGSSNNPATTTPPAATSPAGSPSATPSAGGEVTITEVDFAFQPDTVNANTSQSLVITNKGSALHNFSIEGTGIDVETQPGETTRLEPVGPSFAPGTYTFFCKYHRTQGMVGTLVASAG
jgi:plastocyanin